MNLIKHNEIVQTYPAPDDSRKVATYAVNISPKKRYVAYTKPCRLITVTGEKKEIKSPMTRKEFNEFTKTICGTLRWEKLDEFKDNLIIFKKEIEIPIETRETNHIYNEIDLLKNKNFEIQRSIRMNYSIASVDRLNSILTENTEKIKVLEGKTKEIQGIKIARVTNNIFEEHSIEKSR